MANHINMESQVGNKKEERRERKGEGGRRGHERERDEPVREPGGKSKDNIVLHGNDKL